MLKHYELMSEVILSKLDDSGQTLEQVRSESARTNRRVVAIMVRESLLFQTLARQDGGRAPIVILFKTKVARDHYADCYKLRIAERDRQRALHFREADKAKRQAARAEKLKKSASLSDQQYAKITTTKAQRKITEKLEGRKRNDAHKAELKKSNRSDYVLTEADKGKIKRLDGFDGRSRYWVDPATVQPIFSSIPLGGTLA